MLINHEYKFIFIHIYKVAGTSLLNAFANQTYSPFVPWEIRPALTRLSRKMHWPFSFPIDIHASALQARQYLGNDIFSSYFKFAFVRNPWDWQVSLYEYAKQTRKHPQHNSALQFEDFDEYLYWRINHDKHLQKEFVTDDSDNIILDFIGKYENLESDVSKICLKINELNSGKASFEPKLAHFNKTKTRNSYLNYYDDTTYNLVREQFKEDVELFGYF